MPESRKYSERAKYPDNFSFCAFRINHAGDLIFANDNFVRLLGFSSFAELQNYSDMHESLEKCFSPQRFYSYLKNNNKGINQFTWVTKNESKILLKEYAYPVFQYESIAYFDCIVEDVSEKNLVSKILNDINSNDGSILKAIPDFIFVVSHDGTIIENKNNCRKLFPSINNIAGLHLIDVFPTDISYEILSRIKEVLASGDQQSFDFQFAGLEEKKFFEARLLLKSYNEVVIILRDITVQKNTEQQIKKITEELKQLNSTKDKFFSIIGHDLRTPLNGLLGYAEILSNEINDLGKEEISEFADSIAEIARSVTALLNNLLEWARIQNGKIAFEPRKFLINSLIEKGFRLLHASASKKQIQLINALDPALELCVDENMFYSIVLNLVSNAIKFTQTGGYVKLACKELDDMFEFSVTDNGIGIAEENIRKLIDVNESFSTSGTAKEKGTGLGLTLCKEFVKKHNGHLKIESKVGEGATFIFTIHKELPTQSRTSIHKDISGTEKLKC